jgi:hypothetical protein
MDYLLFTSEEILERVDEYTLYCSYLGYEPLIGAKYISPLRSGMDSSKTDTDPSFGIFERKYGKGTHQFLWKDQGLGIHGDVFDLVQRTCKLCTRREALLQVLVDTGHVPGTASRPVIDIREKRFMGCANIQISVKPYDTRCLNYWERIHVAPSLLEEYYTRQLRMYWLYEDQQWPRYPKGLGFSYQIYDKYQLYFPWEEKKRKFRTDWTDVCVPGFLQLKYNSPLLIITKSMKDVIVLRSFGYEAIAPRGENILLPKECIQYMKKHYERILVLFDNDGKHKGDEYEFPKIFVPKVWDNDKDVSDFCSNHGAGDTSDMLRQITES